MKREEKWSTSDLLGLAEFLRFPSAPANCDEFGFKAATITDEIAQLPIPWMPLGSSGIGPPRAALKALFALIGTRR